jgi:hypothetical protein
MSGIGESGVILCIAQLARTVSDICRDVSAPGNVNALAQLLAKRGGGGILDYASEGQTILLVCPEFAFSGADWHEIDALVRGFPQPLIVAAGFGISTCETLHALLRSNGVTPCWSETPPARMNFNFGAIWIHAGAVVADAESTRCFVFGKTFPEQVHEVELGVHAFASHACIELDDVVLWPFICADALRESEPESVVLNIVGDSHSRHKPNLSLGLLFQQVGQGDTRWVRAISNLTAKLAGGMSTVVIANAATRRVDSSVRNLSGVYASFGMAPHLAGACRLHGTHQDGQAAWRLRTSRPTAAVCKLYLSSYAATTHLHPVLSHQHWRIDAGAGLVEDQRCALALDLCAATDIVTDLAAGNGLFAHVKTLRSALESHQGGTAPALKATAESWLGGPVISLPTSRCLHESHNAKSVDALEICAQAVGGLMSPPRSRPGLALDFRVPDGFSTADFRPASGTLVDTPVWFWNDPHQSTTQLLSSLVRAIVGGALQPGAMLVFGRGADSDFLEGSLANSGVNRRPDQPTIATGQVGHPRLATDAARDRTRNIRLHSLGWAAGLWKDSASPAGSSDADAEFDRLLDDMGVSVEL